jgi:hypothetical protein
MKVGSLRVEVIDDGQKKTKSMMRSYVPRRVTRLDESSSFGRFFSIWAVSRHLGVSSSFGRIEKKKIYYFFSNTHNDNAYQVLTTAL